MRLLQFITCLALAIVLFVGPSAAQLTTARLEGNVQDASGALVPGAKVEVVNVKTQARAETTTDAQGHFVLPSLVPSEYMLTVEAQGFRKAVRNNLVLTVAETVTEIIKLELGAVTDSVVVEANAVRVQTADAQIARAVTMRDIDNLPQLGRGPIVLSVFNAGVQIDPGDNSYSHVNGTRQGSSNATLDGIEVNDPMAPRMGLSMTPNTSDTVEEFKMVTNGGKAEYGRNGGGQIQMITRSGTNEFHGGAWDYLRNTVLNANSFSNNYAGTARPMYIRNIFGGNGGGRIRKDKTFFFGSYEGTRTHQQVSRNRTVLTPQAKQGIFRWTNNGVTQSWDILKNDPKGKGIDPAVKALIGRLPEQNNTDIGDGLNTAGFRFNAPANSFNDQYTFKIDHQLWSTNRVFLRWSWMRTYSIDTTNSAEARYPGDENGRQGGHRMGWSAGSDWTITNTLVNELRVGGQKSNSDFLRPRLHEAMIVPLLYTSPIANPTDFAQGRTIPYTEITENLSKIAGKHTFKGGVNVRITKQNTWREDYAWAAVRLSSTSFGNTPPASAGPPSSAISNTDRQKFDQLYNDLLGRVSDVQVRYYSDLQKYQPAGTGRVRNFTYKEMGFFFQDDWKVTRRFTVNAGLRWEFFGVPSEDSGLQGTFDKISQMDRVNRLSNFTVVKGGSYYNNDWNNFAPRLGFAWDVFGDGKTSLRGSSGIFYERLINATLTPADSLPGFQSDMFDYPNQAGADFRYSDGLKVPTTPSSIMLTPLANRSISVTGIVPNLRTGYVVQNNLTIQREVFRNTVVELGYVGTRGIKLFMQNNVNQTRIYDDFLGAFKQIQAYQKDKTPVPATNTLVRMFGTPDAAITALGSTNVSGGAAGAAANNIDVTASSYAKYANAGVSDYYLRNFPQFSYAYLCDNSGRSYYNSLQLSVMRQVGALRVNANYTFSKSIDNWANEGNGTDVTSVMDWNNLILNRGRSDFDHPHSFNARFVYTLPVGRNRRFLGSAPRWVDSLLGGWDLGVLNFWQSGSVFSVSSGRATGPNGYVNTWVDYAGDRNVGSLDRSNNVAAGRGTGVYYFTDAEKTAMTVPMAGNIGTSGRNAFRGPRNFNVDATLSKRFKVTESKYFTFRAEAYNAFNSANFGTPTASVANLASLGKFSGTVSPARVVQAALRFNF